MEMLIYQIEHLAGKWLEFMVASSVQLGLFLLLIIAITAVFKNQSARFLYWIWLIGLLKIFVPPNIKLPAFLLHSKFVLDNNIPMLFIPEIQLANTTAPGLSYQGYLFLLWVIIIALLFAFWIYKLIRFRSHVTQLCHEITGRIQLDRDMDMLNRVRFFTGPNIDMPFTKGFFAPKIYLPASVLGWRQSELTALIFHELAHIQRKDLLVIVIQNAMQLLYFFHPLVWLANIQISRYREKACDDFAIHAMHGKSLEYGKLLLKSIDHAIGWKPIPSLSTQFHQSKKFLLNRFHYILNRKGNIMTKLKFSQKLALIGLIIFGIALSCQKQTLKETKGTNEKPTRAIQEKPQAEKAKLPGSFQSFDVPPTPIGGFEAIQEKLIYPEYARKSRVEGTVVVQAKIDTAGYVIDTHILQSLDKGGCDEAAITAINAVKWKPAQIDGNPVTVWVSIPVRFKVKTTIIDAEKPHDHETATLFVPYDEAPQPIGGFAAIQENLVYPEIARRAGIEGTVAVQAKISESGEVIKARILQSLGENNGCDEAAIAAIKAVKWQPAKATGQPVSVWVSIPVRFEINPDQIPEKRLAVPSGHNDTVIDKIEDQPLIYASPEVYDDRAKEFFVPYDDPPDPIGGFAAIQKNLVYPELAQKAGIEGTVTVQARIDEDGNVIDTRILIPLGNSGCNEAAVAAIKSVKWKPAKQKDKPVVVWIAVPVRFKLH